MKAKNVVRVAILWPLIVPFAWTIGWVVLFLLEDSRAATSTAKAITRDVVFGMKWSDMSKTIYAVASHVMAEVDCDLSECAIEHAIENLKANHSKALILVAPMSSAYAAGMVCQKYGLGFIGVPDCMMEKDSWMVCGDYKGFCSKGA